MKRWHTYRGSTRGLQDSPRHPGCTPGYPPHPLRPQLLPGSEHARTPGVSVSEGSDRGESSGRGSVLPGVRYDEGVSYFPSVVGAPGDSPSVPEARGGRALAVSTHHHPLSECGVVMCGVVMWGGVMCGVVMCGVVMGVRWL